MLENHYSNCVLNSWLRPCEDESRDAEQMKIGLNRQRRFLRVRMALTSRRKAMCGQPLHGGLAIFHGKLAFSSRFDELGDLRQHFDRENRIDPVIAFLENGDALQLGDCSCSRATTVCGD